METSNVTSGSALFASGRWATQQLKAAALQGRALTSDVLRTADTLRHEEWKFFDQVLVKAATIRLIGVADLLAAGFVRNVTGALGKTVFGYEKVTDMDPAVTSLNGRSRTQNDRQEFSLNQLPLPITHKDFFIDLRTLAASRNGGDALDTTQVETAGRVVAEQLEKMLFQGGPTFGGLPLYGYITHPDRNVAGFDSTKNWGDATKVGSGFLNDVITMKNALIADRFYGPYTIYVPTNAETNLDKDYNAGSANVETIRQRLLRVSNITAIRVADQLPAGSVIMKQDSADVASWVSGEPLQTVQWDEYGGFEVNFKAWAIGIPLLRSDYLGRMGLFHMS